MYPFEGQSHELRPLLSPPTYNLYPSSSSPLFLAPSFHSLSAKGSPPSYTAPKIPQFPNTA